MRIRLRSHLSSLKSRLQAIDREPGEPHSLGLTSLVLRDTGHRKDNFMTSNSVSYTVHDRIATIQIDDGKRNALSPEVLRGIYDAFDEAERDKAIVILTGRESVLSAGFDLKVMKKGGRHALQMLGSGYALTARIMAYPYPVIAACNGHVFAMGVFMMLSSDYIIGSRGDFKIAANEVAIGLTMPRVAAAMLKHRLIPSAYQRAVTVSHYFDTHTALTAGLFDELVEPDELTTRAQFLAGEYQKLDQRAHTASKRRIRRSLIRKIRWSIPLDLLDAALIGLRRSKAK